MKRLSSLIADLFEPSSSCIDVGCGDGRLARRVAECVPGTTMRGVEVRLRNDAAIRVDLFDGHTLPFDDNSFDVALLIDVLHHTNDSYALLHESIRVARKAVIIKDHIADGVLARQTLRYMDRVGNRRFDVALPHNYLAKWRTLGVRVAHFNSRLKLYPFPLSLAFDRSLHFLARIEKQFA